MVSLSGWLERVAGIMQEVNGAVIEPRFRALREGDVWSKAAHEVVTVADEEAERLLTARLRDLLPGVPVVGEEACAGDPTLLDALGWSRAWLVDPVDGTANFVGGSTGTGRLCAGFDYPALIEGEQDFVLFWRTLPWNLPPDYSSSRRCDPTGRGVDRGRRPRF